jgi:hypothetical protein
MEASMSSFITLFSLLFLFTVSAKAQMVLVKQTVGANKSIELHSVEYIEQTAKTNAPEILRDLPLFMGEEDFTSPERYQEILYPNLPLELAFKTSKQVKTDNLLLDHELRTIIKQGPDKNRIILTIIGDGYTLAEKNKFFSDVQMLVDDMFVGVTFKSYLSMFNIYAVFVPSNESGITDRIQKDTVFGLYRSPVGSKRGIMPGNRTNIEKALDLAPAAAHYPIIIANDQFYGGLGGRYAITSSSPVSGAVVLRHELGHNFSNVGEEYDGGQVYQGANFSPTVSGSWDQWKVDNNQEAHKAQHLFGAYVWKPLTQPFVQKFKFAGNDSLFDVRISSVGWENQNDVEILLDGKPLELTGAYTYDRSFFETTPFPLSAGEHELIIRSNGNRKEHVLAYARGYAYPLDYDFQSGEVKAYNVFNESERMVGYRPTEHMCLMRDMVSKVFCPVDQENIWLQFLKRISLIDSVEVVAQRAVLKTIPLSEQDLEIRWYQRLQRAELEIEEFRNMSEIPLEKLTGAVRVEVQLKTPEVRKNSEHFTDTATINL